MFRLRYQHAEVGTDPSKPPPSSRPPWSLGSATKAPTRGSGASTSVPKSRHRRPFRGDGNDPERFFVQRKKSAEAEIFFGHAAHLRSDHHTGRSWGRKGERRSSKPPAQGAAEVHAGAHAGRPILDGPLCSDKPALIGSHLGWVPTRQISIGYDRQNRWLDPAAGTIRVNQPAVFAPSGPTSS
jgi:hypothetical protein